MGIYEKIREYIPHDEKILATIESNPFGGTRTIWVATERRLVMACQTSLFTWHFDSAGWEHFTRVYLKENIFSCTIHLTARKVKTGEDISCEIPSVNKKDGRRFVATAMKCIEQHNEISVYKIKTCPECDEIVSWKAKRCKHCGYIF